MNAVETLSFLKLRFETQYVVFNLNIALLHRLAVLQDFYLIDLFLQISSFIPLCMEYYRIIKKNIVNIPERIIFYRDGVSKGKFSQDLLYEINVIWKSCV